MHLIDVLAAALLLAFPIPFGHSHNDYNRPRPLLDALDAGVKSVEADVFLKNGDLFVSHDESGIKAGNTLKAMYLDPLKARADSLPGELWLLVDIKKEGEAVYAKLAEQLESYRPMLTSFSMKDGVSIRSVRVILSGDRPLQTVRKLDERLVFLDGRLTDLDPNFTDAQLYPLISDDWATNFVWRGKGEIPFGDEAKLRLIVERAHKQKQKVRFWDTPENENVWRTLRKDGVDLIGTDDLAKLKAFAQTSEG
ncbi:phosphatidylinositol-specific phospholipase C/glycerophosphodiester phosphodiesterase family protein [soil metagenome]